MSNLFYRPDLKPKRDYMSDAEIEKIKEDLIDSGPEDEDGFPTDGGSDADGDSRDRVVTEEDINELLEDIDDMLGVMDIMPDPIDKSLIPSLEEIRRDIETIGRVVPDGEDEDFTGDDPSGDITIDAPTREDYPEVDGPSIFPENKTPPIIVVPPKPLKIVLENTFQIDKTEIYREFINRLRMVIDMYIRELLYNSSVGDFLSYKDLFYHYSLSSNDLPENLRHVGDGIVRSQIERGQKARFFKKIYNIDQTIFHLRSNKASHELRKRYYDTKFGKSRTYLETQSNDFLRGDRLKYDKKYEQNMYNFYKYLNGSVILVDEVLQTFVNEAKGKAVLNKAGVDVNKGHREEEELAEKVKKKREKEKKKREKKNSKEEKERLERYAMAGKNPNGNALGETGGQSYSSQVVPTGDNAKVVELAMQWSQTRGKGSSNPVKYSMVHRSNDYDLKQWGDCSSFTRRIFLDANKGDIGLNTAAQITNKKGKFFTDMGQIEPGDLIFFSPTGSHKISVTLPNGKSASVAHVAIYIGGTEYVDLSAGIGTISTQNYSSGTPKKLMDSTFLGIVRF